MNTEFLTEKDAAGWMELVRQVRTLFPGLDDESALADHRQQLTGFISRKEAIAAKDESLRGGILFSRRDNEICFLATDSRYRRQGLGTQLVKAALAQLDTGRDITLYTYTRKDEKGAAARAFYQKLGFVPGRVTNLFGRDVQQFVLKK